MGGWYESVETLRHKISEYFFIIRYFFFSPLLLVNNHSTSSPSITPFLLHHFFTITLSFILLSPFLFSPAHPSFSLFEISPLYSFSSSTYLNYFSLPHIPFSHLLFVLFLPSPLLQFFSSPPFSPFCHSSSQHNPLVVLFISNSFSPPFFSEKKTLGAH